MIVQTRLHVETVCCATSGRRVLLTSLSFAHCTSQQLFLVTQLRIVWALHFLSVKKKDYKPFIPYKHQLFTNLLCRVVVRSSHKWMHEPMVESDFSQTMYNLFKRTSTCCKVVFCEEWRLGLFLALVIEFKQKHLCKWFSSYNKISLSYVWFINSFIVYWKMKTSESSAE